MRNFIHATTYLFRSMHNNWTIKNKITNYFALFAKIDCSRNVNIDISRTKAIRTIQSHRLVNLFKRQLEPPKNDSIDKRYAWSCHAIFYIEGTAMLVYDKI